MRFKVTFDHFRRPAASSVRSCSWKPVLFLPTKSTREECGCGETPAAVSLCPAEASGVLATVAASGCDGVGAPSQAASYQRDLRSDAESRRRYVPEPPATVTLRLEIR